MAKSYVDGKAVNTVGQLIAALRAFQGAAIAGKQPVLYVTDTDGNPLERVKLFETTLTDGSTTLDVELHFEQD